MPASAKTVRDLLTNSRVDREPEVQPLGWLTAAVLGGVALAVRLRCYTGLIGSDDVIYAQHARGIAASEFLFDSHFATRLGLLLPLAGAYRLAGVSEWSTAILPLAASVASVPLIVAIGRTLFGFRAGLFAGLLLATFPLAVRHGSILVPEPVAEFYVLAAAAVFFRYGGKSELRAGALAGALFGLAYLTREIAVFVLAAFLIDAVVKKRVRLAAGLAAGSLAIAILEHTYYAVAAGDLLFRLHSVGAHNARPTALHAFQYPFSRFVAYLPETMLLPRQSFGLHSMASCALAVSAFWCCRWERLRTLALWALLPALYLNFGSTSLSAYVPMPVADRYLQPLYPPLFVLAGAALAAAWERGTRARVAVATVLTIVALVGLTGAYAVRGSGWRTAEVRDLREIARNVEQSGEAVAKVRGPEACSLSLEIIAPQLLAAGGSGFESSQKIIVECRAGGPVGIIRGELPAGSGMHPLEDKR